MRHGASELKRRLPKAIKKVMGEVTAKSREGRESRKAGAINWGGAISTEGYAGGYLQALFDVEAILNHGGPSDPRHYWSEDKNE